MGGLWVGLSGGKALIAVIGHRAVLLAEPLFDCDHLVAGSRGAAIHPGHKPLHDGGSFVIGYGFFRLLLLDGVFEDIWEALGEVYKRQHWDVSAGRIFRPSAALRLG